LPYYEQYKKKQMKKKIETIFDYRKSLTWCKKSFTTNITQSI